MVPLRITLTLRAPMVLTRAPLHLDSVLTRAAALLRDGPAALDYNPLNPIAPPPPDLPIAKFGRSARWIYRASAARFVPPVLYDRDAFSSGLGRRADLVYPGQAIAFGVGLLRQKISAFTTTLPAAVVFYCVGDPAGVRALLDHVTHLGKDYTAGFGEIDRRGPVLVEPIPEDRSLVWRGQAMRAIPDDLAALLASGPLGGATLRAWTFQPPYKDARPSHIARCYVPIIPAMLGADEEAGLEWLRPQAAPPAANGAPDDEIGDHPDEEDLA